LAFSKSSIGSKAIHQGGSLFRGQTTSVGKIATYERSREEALALTDPALQEQALDDAVAQLETAFGRTLTPAQVDRIDALLDARQ
jgi:hypothetical protein